MASFRKRGDKWQARVHRQGAAAPVVKTFITKAVAIKWARNVESQLDLEVFAPKQVMPRLKTVVERYVAEVTLTKKGESQERYRATQLMKTKLADLFMDKITSEVVAKYRDQRLTQVSNNTVRLELAFLSVVLSSPERNGACRYQTQSGRLGCPSPANQEPVG